jgi:hypothetical protein
VRASVDEPLSEPTPLAPFIADPTSAAARAMLPLRPW